MLINLPKIATFEVVGSAEVSFAVLIARNKLLCVVSFRDTVCSQLVTILECTELVEHFLGFFLTHSFNYLLGYSRLQVRQLEPPFSYPSKEVAVSSFLTSSH